MIWSFRVAVDGTVLEWSADAQVRLSNLTESLRRQARKPDQCSAILVRPGEGGFRFLNNFENLVQGDRVVFHGFCQVRDKGRGDTIRLISDAGPVRLSGGALGELR